MNREGALPSGARARWLVPGGGVALVSVVLFVAAIALRPVLAIVGIVITAIWFAAMVVAALVVHERGQHARTQATLMIAMCACASIVLLLLFLLPPVR